MSLSKYPDTTSKCSISSIKTEPLGHIIFIYFYRLLVIGRVVRIVGLLRIYTEKKNLTKGARLMVSENKRRYRQDGFDLDLVYVTGEFVASFIITCSKGASILCVPGCFVQIGSLQCHIHHLERCHGIETQFKWVICYTSGFFVKKVHHWMATLWLATFFFQEVERFFSTKHPNHYRIYNMCSEDF